MYMVIKQKPDNGTSFWHKCPWCPAICPTPSG